MSKIIKLGAENIKAICEEFAKQLSNFKMSEGKLSITKTFNDIDRKADLYFAPEAYIKMTSLVSMFTDEVGWHGIAYRGDDESKDDYYITDIIVYPQEVTGSTVTPDQKEYQNWLMSHDDDVFNNIRMQGHSHVNMGVTPSGVDTNFYEEILSQLTDDMFYIFMIWNKRGEKTIKIYDLKKNILFETGDVNVHIGVGDLEDFLADAKEKVVKKTYTTPYGVAAKEKDGKSQTDKSEKRYGTYGYYGGYNYEDCYSGNAWSYRR